MLFSEPKIPQWLLSELEMFSVEMFQCSSASRKFLNPPVVQPVERPFVRCFSALQRAENSSIVDAPSVAGRGLMFQCSSASRKFLNSVFVDLDDERTEVSVLFSEPKIPQFAFYCDYPVSELDVSVLFSEPKIPQCWSRSVAKKALESFSALQRAENSSIRLPSGCVVW